MPMLTMEESQSLPPNKVARFATVLMESEPSSSSIQLNLGLGPGIGKPVFTIPQLQEFEHQALIYKHLASGEPVPLHLILPIWKSLAGSFGSVPGGSTGMYPGFLGCKGIYYDYKNSMEPEPGRCRRTDGKKWRCSKDVVPDQKYCEKHMHRGRNRSRKPVEITSHQLGSSSSSSSSSSHINNSSNTNISISIPLQLMTTTTSSTMTNNTTLGFSPKSVLQNGNGGTCKEEEPLV